MSSKTRNAEKAKTASEPRGYLLHAVSALILLSFVVSIISLVVLEPKTAGPVNGNCKNISSESELFHCNVTELEYVVEPPQRQLGLSGRGGLMDNQGMVFVFDEQTKQCMWMKDMKFSLDIAWLNEDKKIVKLVKDISPDTYPANFCADDTRYVLEVNSGVLDKLGIGVGDSIQL